MNWLVRFSMAALMPRSEALPGVEDANLDAFVRRFRTESSPTLWWVVVLGAILFMFTPLLTLGVPLPACVLPRRWLERHAERVAYHRIYLLRQAILGLRAVAGLCWGRDPTVRGHLGLPPLDADPGTWRTS